MNHALVSPQASLSVAQWLDTRPGRFTSQGAQGFAVAARQAFRVWREQPKAFASIDNFENALDQSGYRAAWDVIEKTWILALPGPGKIAA